VERVLHVLTGCTGVGKTEWALRWASERGAEIVSCDSLLFYRGMDIGTAKPSAEERSRVPHHLIDILGLSETMNVARYAALARAAVSDIEARGRTAMVVGGSGFYLKSFFSAVADDTETSPEIRARVAALLGDGGLGAVLSELCALNPDGLGALDAANPRRVTRALERCLATGRTLRDQAAAFARRPAPFADRTIRLLRLDLPAAELEKRIRARAAAMLGAGLVEETERLLSSGLRDNPSASRAIGYREVIAMIDGRLPRERLEEEIAANTRALARKQRTWFRTQLPEHPAIGPRDDPRPGGVNPG
jgi:tRNA dimethylallyltransferase